MSLAEAIVNGAFSILRMALSIALLIWLYPIFMRQLSRHIGGNWGQPTGHLPAFSPRRLWCRHPVSYYGQGTHGLWAIWCDGCGRRLDRR